MNTADPLASARSVLAAQPFNSLVGAELTEFGPDGATLEVGVRDDLRQQFGYVHGGVVSYLVDNVVTFAAGAVLGARVVTAGFTIDYVRPATGDRLVARAVVVRAGSTSAVVQCRVHAVDADGGRTLCAVAQGRVSVQRGRD